VVQCVYGSVMCEFSEFLVVKCVSSVRFFQCSMWGQCVFFLLKYVGSVRFFQCSMWGQCVFFYCNMWDQRGFLSVVCGVSVFLIVLSVGSVRFC